MLAYNAKSLARTGAVLIVLLSVAVVAASSTFQVVAKNHNHSSVTGYFGLDDEGVPIVDRHGIMLVFDGAIASETVSVSTFDVFHDENSQAEVANVLVDGAYVFLKVKEELASDAMPILMIAEGEEVEDLAGNSTNRRKLGAIRIKDGIAPKLTVTLSGGSGTGTGDESPSRLTNKTIDIRITSDEPLQGAPRIFVVCSELSWTEKLSDGDVARDIDDFIANRNGPFPRKPSEPPDTVYTCGYDDDGDGKDDAFKLTEYVAHSRPGDVWEYTWRNVTEYPWRISTREAFHDGKLAFVAYGRDRSRYERYGEMVSNWATASEGFGLDTQFDGLGVPDGVFVIPEEGTVTQEHRPFVLIEFLQTDTVTLTSVIFDSEEIVEEFQVTKANQFVYWPLSMKRGQHKVEVLAQDPAGNILKFNFEFETADRGDYVLELLPGWNAISFSTPVLEPFVERLFTEPAVEAVLGWKDGDWQLALRRNGVWESNASYERLDGISIGYGYWVKSSSYVHQSVKLPQPDPRIRPPFPILIDPPTNPGWNFVGVSVRNGLQTEDNFGEALLNLNYELVTAREYLGTYRFAYTWDSFYQRFDQLLPDDPMVIGNGVWVHYEPADP